MVMKYRKIVSFESECYPKKCKECPCYSTKGYCCHNESGILALCELGFMDGKDMRDFYGNTKYEYCNIANDARVIIPEGL